MTTTTTPRRTVSARITIEQHDVLEWGIEIDGVLWAAGDCESIEDGERQARAELRAAGFDDPRLLDI